MAGVLPTNMGTETVRAVFVDSLGEPRSCPLDELARVQVERVQPVRDFFSWPGQRTFQGWWWSATTRSLLAFESLLEREALMACDFDPRVRGIAVQPFALLWPRRSSVGRSHVPDLFLRLADGTGVVVDVRPEERIDEYASAQFDATRQACEEAGWAYRVHTGLSQPRLGTLTFLSGYRSSRYAPSARTSAALLEAFATPLQLQVGAKMAGSQSETPLEVMLVACYHLLWEQQLRVDLESRLTMTSLVS